MQPTVQRFFSNKFFLFFFLITIHIAFWLIRKPHQPTSDDLVYFQNAKSVIAGDYLLDASPKNHRLMVFAPPALFICMFGASPYVISLWTLLCSLATIAILFLFLSKYSSLMHAFAAGLLLACNILQIDYSASLFPDVIVALFAFLFLIEIFKARLNNKAQWSDVLKAVLFFYLGFLSKEIILLTLPFVLFLFIHDIKSKKHFIYWKKFFLVLIIAGIALNGAYYLLTGDINFIYHSINTRHSEFYALHSSNEIFNRLTYQPVLLFAGHPGYVILFLLLLLFFFIERDLTHLKLNSVTGFFLVYLIILLATYWWFPISFNHATFIQLDGRMWMLLLVSLCIIGGSAAVKMLEQSSNKFLQTWIIIFSVASLAALVFVSPQRSLMFFFFIISAGITFLLKRKISSENILSLLVLLLPAIILALRFTIENSSCNFH